MTTISKKKIGFTVLGIAVAAGLAYRFIPGFASAVNNGAGKVGDLAGKAGDMISGGAAAAGDAVATAGDAVADVTVAA